MARRLAANVVMVHPETGAPCVFTAGTVPPSWAADRITNPDVWAPAEHVEVEGGGAVEPTGPAAPTPPEPAARVVVEAPPRSGKGANRDAWAAYAETLGVAFTDDMGRDEIIAAVEAHQP